MVNFNSPREVIAELEKRGARVHPVHERNVARLKVFMKHDIEKPIHVTVPEYKLDLLKWDDSIETPPRRISSEVDEAMHDEIKEAAQVLLDMHEIETVTDLYRKVLINTKYPRKDFYGPYNRWFAAHREFMHKNGSF